MSDQFEQIRAYRKMGENWASSGQPRAEEFAWIGRAGYQVVINLALPSSDHALPDEGAFVTREGMTYIHLPVRFDAPEVGDFNRFARVMDAFHGEKVWVHCAANMRVSAFLFAYRVGCCGVVREQALQDLNSVWPLDETWQSWLDQVLKERGGRHADVMRALRYAAHQHRGQRRKDAAATPYINHPIAVAETLAAAGGGGDFELMQAALLHDTVEDTETTSEDLEKLFGPVVRALVLEVTDDRSLTKEMRKRMQIEHAPSMSKQAKQLKIADKICNCTDLTREEPAGWTRERKLEYLDWAERVVAGCRGCNAVLEQTFDQLLLTKRDELK